MLCTSGFVDDVSFSRNGPYGASYTSISKQREDTVTAETTASIPVIQTTQILIVGNTSGGAGEDKGLSRDVAIYSTNIYYCNQFGAKSLKLSYQATAHPFVVLAFGNGLHSAH